MKHNTIVLTGVVVLGLAAIGLQASDRGVTSAPSSAEKSPVVEQAYPGLA